MARPGPGRLSPGVDTATATDRGARFTALCAGLLRMFLRPGLPTAQAAARTLDLPVLAAAPLKAR